MGHADVKEPWPEPLVDSKCLQDISEAVNNYNTVRGRSLRMVLREYLVSLKKPWVNLFVAQMAPLPSWQAGTRQPCHPLAVAHGLPELLVHSTLTLAFLGCL